MGEALLNLLRSKLSFAKMIAYQKLEMFCL